MYGGRAMSTELKIKGSTLRSKLLFAHHRCGDSVRSGLETDLRSHGIDPILDHEWYAYGVFDGLLRRLAELCLDGELPRLREVGQFSAEMALETTFDPNPESGTAFLRFLHRIRILHRRFYSAGRVDFSFDELQRRCQIQVSGAPLSEADRQVAAGFYLRTAELMGIPEPDCRIEADEQAVRFLIRWA